MSHGASGGLAGVLSIDLVPTFSAPGVVRRLRAALDTARSLRAAVAYWTIKQGKLSPVLAQRLAGAGFLCVDLNLPTNIDELLQLHSSGANVYLHLLAANPQPGELKLHMPPHLMHAKMLLFDAADERSELWTGSHNWTPRALSGLNMEASLVVGLSPSSSLYSSAVAYLDAVRSSCVRFDPDQVDYYKWLQGQALEGAAWVVELTSDTAGGLDHSTITLFMSSPADYGNLKKVDKDIVLAVTEPSSGLTYLYTATIVGTGYVNKAGVPPDPHLFSFHFGSPRPPIEGPGVAPKSRIDQSTCWATVQVTGGGTREVGFAACDMPVGHDIPLATRWAPVEKDPFEGRISKEDRSLFDRPGRALVQRPAPPDAFYGKGALRREETCEAAREEKREKPLMQRKIVRQQIKGKS